MTTIVYNHEDKEIAYDSRVTKGSYIATDNQNKRISAKGVDFFLSGDNNCILKVVDNWPEIKEGIDCCGFVVISGVVKWLSSGCDWSGLDDCYYSEAAGSGEDHAITAIDLGCSAKKAVEMAAKRDSHTGGTINVFNVK